MTDKQNDFFCTDIAWKHGVPLMATATRGDIWFLIEYPSRWEAKAFECSDISTAVKIHLGAAKNEGFEVRTLLIRKPERKDSRAIQYFIGITSQQNPRLYSYKLENYEEILDIDILSLASNQSGGSAYLRSDPLYLVCANGRRDKCCSIYGPEVYQAISEGAGDGAWQSSHIGGHNQAPIMMFFPHGVNYAHTTPSEAVRLVRAYRDGSIVLHHYRGRVCFEPHIQAAEHFWREQTGIVDLPGLKVESSAEINKTEWVVSLRGMDGDKCDIHLKRHQSDFEIPITCSKSKTSPIFTYSRID